MGRGGVAVGFFWGSVVTMGAYYCYLWLVQPDVMRKQLQGRRDRPCDNPDSKEGAEDEKAQKQRKKRSAKSSSRSTRTIVDGNRAIHRTSMISDVIQQLWHYIRVAGANMIRDTVEPSLAAVPGSFKFSKIDLGDSPLKMDNIYVHPLKDGVVQMDMDVVWDGRCRIDLTGSLVTFGVEQIKFNGRMCIMFKPLTNDLPVVQALTYAFINPPVLSLKYTGLARVANMKLIEETLKESIDAGLLSMVLPNRSAYKVGAAVDFLDVYHPPRGVARLTLISGRGFVVERKVFGKDDIPDVFCEITLGQTTKKSRTLANTVTPDWQEALDFCVCDRAQIIRVQAWDEDQGPLDPNDDLGVAKITVDDLMQASGRQAELELFDADNGLPTGAFVTIRCDMREWTTDEKDVSSWEMNADEADKAKAPGSSNDNDNDDNLIRGLMMMVVPQAFNVPSTNGSSLFVKVSYQDHVFQTAAVLAPSGNPQFDAYFDIPLTSKIVERGMVDGEDGDCVTFELMRQVNTKTPLPPPSSEGTARVKIVDVLHSRSRTLTRTMPLEGNHSSAAAVAVRVQLCGARRVSEDAPSKAQGSSSMPPPVLSPENAASGSSSSPAAPNVSMQQPSSSWLSSKEGGDGGGDGGGDAYKVNSRDLIGDVSVISTASSFDSTAMSFMTDDANRSVLDNLRGDGVKISVTGGRGFRLHETLFGVEIPDLYCRVRVPVPDSDGKSNKTDEGWLTSTQHDTVTPDWRSESHVFDCREARGVKFADHEIEVIVHRESAKPGFLRERRQRPKTDKSIGCARVTIGDVVVRGRGKTEVELLRDDGSRTGAYVVLCCSVVGPS